MSLHTVTRQLGSGGTGIPDQFPAAVRELQGLNVTVVAGAASSTKMNVAALRSEDTLVSVLAFNTGVPSEDKANCTIVDTHAFGTITVDTVLADDTATVNGVTYTFKAAPTAIGHVPLAGTDNANAANLAAAINSYETRYTSQGPQRAAVVAEANAAVVTVTAVVDGAAGNAITLTSSGATLTVTGAGTLTGGSDTGGFTSSSTNTGNTMVVVWFNKS